MKATLPRDSGIGAVRFRVADPERQRSFYRDVLGFRVLEEHEGVTVLGTARRRPLLVLEASPGAPDRPPGTTGLFHVAYLLPTRGDLAGLVRRVRAHGVPFQGFADHNVSEAAYLADPEGNGIELYADRPKETWYASGGRIFITTEPLDLEGLLRTAPVPATGLAEDARVGHVHLRVSSLAAAEDFYVGRLGFEVVTRAYPGALFVSAGGYHHHVGLNVWGGEGAPRPPAGAAGLVSFEVVVPSEGVRRRILGEAGGQDMLVDPDGNGVRLTEAHA